MTIKYVKVTDTTEKVSVSTRETAEGKTEYCFGLDVWRKTAKTARKDFLAAQTEKIQSQTEKIQPVTEIPAIITTADGYRLRRDGDKWTDGDLTFDSGTNGLPITHQGEALELMGDVLEDDDTRTEHSVQHLKTMMFTQRTNFFLFIVRCFQGDEQVFEYVYGDEEIAIEAGRDWILEGDDTRATIRGIQISPELSIEVERDITLEEMEAK